MVVFPKHMRVDNVENLRPSASISTTTTASVDESVKQREPYLRPTVELHGTLLSRPAFSLSNVLQAEWSHIS